MALFNFSKEYTCDVCGKQTNTANEKRYRLKNSAGCCQTCFNKAKFSFGINSCSDVSLQEMKRRIAHIEQVNARRQQKENETAKMQTTRTVAGRLCINDDKRTWYIKSASLHTQVRSFDDVLESWVDVQTKTTISTNTTNNGLGRAVVGGALAGSTGAIVGAATGKNKTVGNTQFTEEVTLCIRTQDAPNQVWELTNISIGQAELIRDALMAMKAEPTTTSTTEPKDIPTQLREYKALLDDGLITQEDYDAMKAKLLHN